METSPSIAELARQCVESHRQMFEAMEADLDRRLGGVVTRLQVRAASQSSPQQKLPNHGCGEDKPTVASASPESLREPVLHQCP